MRLRLLRVVLLLLMAVNSAGISRAQEDGSGVITEINARSAASTTLDPLACQDEVCTRMTALMFPTLYAVDPSTRYPAEATPENNGLVIVASNVADSIQRLTLRDDLTWSDGKPITAYDVFYSYLAITSGRISTPYWGLSQHILAARPVGEFEIEFAYREVDCTLPFTTNFPVIPAHLYDAQFSILVQDYRFDAADEIIDWMQDWWEWYPPRLFDSMRDYDKVSAVSHGVFHVEGYYSQKAIRLLSENGQLAYVLADQNSPLNPVQLFLNGESNLLFNPPYEARDELLAAPDTQVSQYPGLTALYINLNLADPKEPLPAFDLAGEPLEQGAHPIFGDVRVRRALQLGIDVQTLIDVAYQGYGTPLAANQIPASWAFDETLAPFTYDPTAAGLLLTEAGWRDVNGDGVRECTHCLYGQRYQNLSFELLYPQELGLVAEFIANQLREIGVAVSLSSSTAEAILAVAGFQTYDTYLFTRTESFPVNPDQTGLFTQAGDRYPEGLNTGSYHNPRVEELMQQARTLPGCDPDERAAIYHEIQSILQEDQPYLWLFAPDEMVVASGGVQGFDPLPNAPLWNIRSWRVIR